VRALVGNLGVAFVFWAYALLPMADATALLFAAPLFVTALSPLLIGERVDRFRRGGGGRRFCRDFPDYPTVTGGICQPGVADWSGGGPVCGPGRHHPAQLGQTDTPLTTVFYFLLIGVVVTAPYTLAAGARLEDHFLPGLVGIGLFAALQQVVKTTTYRLAEASLLAPYTYTAIVWAVLAGWIFWKDFATPAAAVGTLIVIGSNLFIVWREAR
jgi:drug/metabolite transporter (DMT)-like permease